VRLRSSATHLRTAPFGIRIHTEVNESIFNEFYHFLGAYGYCPACERKLERCWNCAKITCPAQKRRLRHCYGHLLNKYKQIYGVIDQLRCKSERNNKDVINETDPVHNYKRPREERVPTGTGIKRGFRQSHTHQHHQYANTVQKLLGCHDENKKWQFERELLIVLKQMKKLNMDSVNFIQNMHDLIGFEG